MRVFVKIFYFVFFLTSLFVYANADYNLRRVHIPCSRRTINPFIIKRLALQKIYDDLKLNSVIGTIRPTVLKTSLVQSNILEPQKVVTPVVVQSTPAPKKIDEDPTKALYCAKLACAAEETVSTAVCACNHVTGRVATFKNACDLKRHNCRYDTVFKVILQEICPWEYQFRRLTGEPIIDYSDPKYYNS